MASLYPSARAPFDRKIISGLSSRVNGFAGALVFVLLALISVPAQSATSQIFISTNIPGAAIQIDNGRAHRAPLRIRVLDHAQTIKVTAPGYQDFIRRIPSSDSFLDAPERRVWNVVLKPDLSSNTKAETSDDSEMPVGNPFPSRSEWSEEDRELLRQILTELRDMRLEAQLGRKGKLASRLDKSREIIAKFAPEPERKALDRELAAVEETQVPAPTPAPAPAPTPAAAPSLSISDLPPPKVDADSIRGNRHPGHFVQILSAPAGRDWTYDRKIRRAYQKAFGMQFRGFLADSDQTKIEICGAFLDRNLWQRIMVAVPPTARLEMLKRLKSHFAGSYLVQNPVCIKLDSSLSRRRPAYDGRSEGYSRQPQR